MSPTRPQHKRNRSSLLIAATVLTVAAIGGYLLLVIPTARTQSGLIEQAQQAAQIRANTLTLSTDGHNATGLTYQQMVESRKKVNSYNASLSAKSPSDPFSPRGILPPQSYRTVLSQLGSDSMATLRIPAIHLDRPITYGTTGGRIQGIEHLPQTALPSSMKGIHPVLVGHNGDPDDHAFDDLDQLKIGDVFYITILGQELTYKVDQIRVVRPTDFSQLSAVAGKNYVTLLTCTPRYVDNDRLLVRGNLHSVKDVSRETIQTSSTPTSWWDRQPSWMPYAYWILPSVVFAIAMMAVSNALLATQAHVARHRAPVKVGLYGREVHHD